MQIIRRKSTASSPYLVMYAGADLTANEITNLGVGWCDSRVTTATAEVVTVSSLPAGFIPDCWTYDGATWAVVAEKQTDVDVVINTPTLTVPSLTLTDLTANCILAPDGLLVSYIDVTWQSVLQATSYEIRFGFDEEGDAIKWTSRTVQADATLTNLCRVDALVGGKAYRFAMRATCTWGVTDWTTAVVITAASQPSKLDGIEPGATRNAYRGQWSDTGISYIVGDEVINQGSSWICVANHVSAVGNGPPTLPTTVNGTWSLRASAGATGSATAVVYIYKRSDTAPALPTGTTTYTFATATLTGLDNGWATIVPAGDSPLYMAAATAVGTTSDDIAANEWCSPVVIGSKGVNSATVYLFQRTTSATPPTKPASTLTYTFATAVLSGTLGSWAQTMPTTGGSYRWLVTATAVAAGDTDNIATTEWSTVSLIAQDGTAGADGKSSYTGYLTNENHTVATNADGSGGDYTLATGAFKVLLGTNDVTSSCAFSVAPNANVTGEAINASGVYSITGMSVDSATVSFTALTADATTVTKVFTINKAKKGVDGADGTPGADAQYVVVTGQQSFKFLKDQSVPTVTTIDLKATLYGGLTTYDWEYWNGSAWANLSGTQNASTYSLAYNNAAWGVNTALRIRCLSGTAYDEITIVKVSDGSDGTAGTNGKTYVLNITGGVRGFTYDLGGGSPSPAATAFSCTLLEDGVSKTPTTYAWSTGGTTNGLISGSGTAATFTPTVAASYDAAKGNNYVMLTVTYAGQTVTTSVPIAIAKTGATGETGPAGPGVNRASTPPASPVVGQLWYNTGTTDGTYYANTQYVWSGSAWQVAGPRGTFLNAAGAYIGTLTADQINVEGIDATKITAGTFTGLTFQTSSNAAAQRVVINASDNQFHAYGNKGNGTIAELATIGVPTYGGNGCVAVFGSTSTGTSKIGVVGASNSLYGIQGTSVSSTGVVGTSTSGIGIQAISDSNVGIVASTSSGTHAVSATNSYNSATAIGVEGYAPYGKGVVGTGGVWDFHAEGVGTNGPFTGAHDALISSTTSYDVGDIIVDLEIFARQNVSSTLAKVRPSNAAKEKAVIGVVSMKDIPGNIPVAIDGDSTLMMVLNDHDAIIINALGEGQINVCKDGGNIEAGDYICSSSQKGKGMKQDDDILHSYTVAKAREGCVWAEGEDDIRMIACTYHCG